MSLKCDLISLCCKILQCFRHVPSNLFGSVTEWIHSHCVSELKDGVLSAIQYPIKIHFLPLIWKQGSRIYCASCVHRIVSMIYPDMMHNQFKRKLDFLPLFPEMTHATSMHLNLIKWLQQRQFGGQLLPSVVYLIEERQLFKSHSICLSVHAAD